MGFGGFKWAGVVGEGGLMGFCKYINKTCKYDALTDALKASVFLRTLPVLHVLQSFSECFQLSTSLSFTLIKRLEKYTSCKQ